jgi:hypothetical protein
MRRIKPRQSGLWLLADDIAAKCIRVPVGFIDIEERGGARKNESAAEDDTDWPIVVTASIAIGDGAPLGARRGNDIYEQDRSGVSRGRRGEFIRPRLHL